MTFLSFRGAALRAHQRRLAILTVPMFFSLGLAFEATNVSAQVKESQNRLLRDVAKVTLDRNGQSKITFNPQRCRELGPELCEFFRAHEYGHVNLGHLERGVPTQQAEQEADLWAARNASPQAVAAARQYFLSGKGGSRVHGSSEQRAARMTQGSTVRSSPVPHTNNLPAVNSGKRRISYAANAGPQNSRPVKRIVVYSLRPSYRSATSLRSAPSAKPAANLRPVAPPQQTQQSTVRSTPVVRYYSAPRPTQTRVSHPRGYVPRGDFINPR